MNRNIELLEFRVHVPNLLQEITDNAIGTLPNAGMLFVPLNQFRILLLRVAQRASELNDPKLNLLMCKMALYAESDPSDKENFDPKIIQKLENQITRESKPQP